MECKSNKEIYLKNKIYYNSKLTNNNKKKKINLNKSKILD